MNRALELKPEDEPALRLLEGLQAMEISANEAEVVAGIARFAQSPRLLDFVASVPKWYARWEIRETLYESPHTPNHYRDAIGTSIAVIDLMREMDIRSIEDSEREEIREDIRSLLRQLPPIDHAATKAHARALAVAMRLPPTPPVPSIARLAREAEAQAESEAAARAARTESAADLLAALADPREAVRRAAIENPHLDEATLVAAVRESTIGEAILEVATNPRWSFRDPVRKAVLASPQAPPAVTTLFGTTEGLLLAFMRYFNHPLEPQDKARLAKAIMAEIQELPPPEREYLKYKVDHAWKPFVSEVMRYIEEEFRTLRPTPVTTAWPEPQPPPEATPAPLPATDLDLPSEARRAGSARPETFDDSPHAAVPLHRQTATTETRRSLASLPPEERARIAAATRNRDELAFLIHDADDRVFAALLDNPALGDEEVVAAARNAQRDRIRYLTQNRRAYSLVGIKSALLHNPHTPEPIQLECLGHFGAARELLAVMRDPRIRSLAVKSKARARLLERYRAMTTEERAAAIRQTGGELLNELWSEAFADERTLLKLIQERGVDESIVLKIVRSRVAPRAVLQAIGRDPRFTNNYQVCLELAMNPKTPRELVAKLIPKLSPQDRQRLRTSSDVAESVRSLA